MPIAKAYASDQNNFLEQLLHVNVTTDHGLKLISAINKQEIHITEHIQLDPYLASNL